MAKGLTKKFLPKFSYERVRVDEIEFLDDGSLVIGGRPATPTPRFWQSMCSLYGFGPSIYRYFTSTEVFERVAKRSRQSLKKSDEVQVTREIGDPSLVLSVTNPGKEMIYDDQIVRCLNSLPTKSVQYADGIVYSCHNLRRKVDFEIGKDVFSGCVYLETPLDGYGKPLMFVSLIREVCDNLYIARNKTFRTSVILGKSPEDTLRRAVESYSNEGGYIALKDRIKSAQNSWASVLECVNLGKLLFSLSPDDFNADFALSIDKPISEVDPNPLRNRLLQILGKRSGDLRSIYGVAQLDSISEKRMRQLPAKCRVYDLLNFVTEITTYEINVEDASPLRRWVGDTISTEYDLEDSVDVFDSFDAFIDPKVQSMYLATKQVGDDMGNRKLFLE